MIRIGVVGAGMWGRGHIEAYSRHGGVEIAGICDTDENRLESAGKEFGVDGLYRSVDELLETGLDAVSVATPDDTHTDIVLKAFDAKVHVLCEKPMAKTVDECGRMIAASERAERILMVDWHNRWNPPFVMAYNSARKGDFGDIKYIYYRLSDTTYVATDMLPWADRSSVLWFLGSHAFDTACWIMGKKPVSVFCRKGEGVLKSMGVDTPDYFISTVGFEDGSTAVIENSWIISRHSPALIDHKCEILGTEGSAYLDPTHNRAFAKYTAGTAAGYPDDRFPDMFVNPVVHGKTKGFALESIASFADCLIDGTAPLADGYDGLLNTRLLTAVENSAESGTQVMIDG